ncbi:helix-turn-helix domain-containing protein [Embleya sp. NBC_00896]|uniref:helix-turn-helix domain-containing protein n=1 Tax=Embleya sp. NBC_00896 TaxID=2975961 RepID=UPI003867961F|nr:PucR family transcriptional regulator [Embleya sp. NBC_00896]
MRVEELLGIPELRLALLAGTEGPGREVRGVYPANLPGSGRELAAGELVVVGAAGCGEDPARFVRVLAGGGAAAMVVLGDVPHALVEACGRAGLPLFLAPRALAYDRIAAVVAARVGAERALGAERLLRRQRGLIAAVAEGADTQDLVDLLASELGAACRVVSPAGRVLAAAGPMSGAAEIARAALAAERLPVVVGGNTVFALGRGPALVGYLVCAGDRTADPALAQSTDLLVLAGARRAERLTAERAHAWELVDLVESGAEPAEVRARLAAAGVAAEAVPIVCCSAGEAADAVTGRLVEDLIEHVLAADPAARWVVAHGKEESVVFASAGPGGAGRIARALERAARWWEPLLGRERVAVGIGGTSPTWGTALAEARGARDLAWARPGRLAVAAGHEIDAYPALLAAVPERVRAVFADRVLGGLRGYDAEHGTDLVGTLAAFLAVNGSWQRCAAMLRVHVSTLHQRMGRVRDLTGRDLFSARDRVDLLLALESVRPAGTGADS